MRRNTEVYQRGKSLLMHQPTNMSTTVSIALDASSVQTVTVHQSVAEVTRKIKVTLKV